MIIVSKAYCIWEKELKRIHSRMVFPSPLILMLISASVFLVRLSVIVAANPIPVPTLMMPEEYINVTISLVDKNLLAEVDGAYPFRNLYYEEVRMDYPLPPNTTNTSVKMNETLLDWTFNNKTYPTIIGDWPMINWSISPVPDYFIMKTHYEHAIANIGGNYTFLYAMGTGRYLQTYAKQTTAYVRIRMETDYSDLHVYTIGDVNQEWMWKAANYTIIQEGTTDIITLNVTSSMFHPLVEDLMLTFNKHWTVDDDGPADFQTIQEAINNAIEGDTIFVRNGTYYENVVVNKTVSLIGESNDDTIINGTTNEFVVYISADNVTFENFTVASTRWEYVYCIYLNGCRHNHVTNNKISTWGWSVYLENSDENTILHNTFGGGYHWTSITLYNSNNNIIIGNQQNVKADVAARLITSSHNLIASNRFTGYLEWPLNWNMATAVQLTSGSNHNTIIKNNMSGLWGLGISNSRGTTIHHNNIRGLDMYESVFVNAWVENAIDTSWDAGYPYGGNWWWGYGGTDVYRGPFQNETGSDGIGDAPYSIDDNNLDRYPLMEPYVQSPNDIGIAGIELSKTIVGLGYNTSLKFRINNYGEETETFNLTIQANSTTIHEQTVTLMPGDFEKVSFAWNTSGCAYGNYTVNIMIDTVPGETDTTDNTFNDCWVLITIPGDVNGDGVVELTDFYLTSQAFGSYPDHPNWNPNADINDDGIVELTDFFIMSSHFGEIW